VWKIEVKAGERVVEGQSCVVLESMKMEMPVEAPQAGVVERVHVSEGQAVNEGDTLVTLV
jgi:acetyl-CoA carboxylase biotin carboxyl carrier protein